MGDDPVEVVRRVHEAYGREDWATTDAILAWELERETLHVEELTPGVVLAVIWTKLRGNASGVETEATDFLVHRLHDGHITETVVHSSEDEARASVA
jgi:hypothetical protein